MDLTDSSDVTDLPLPTSDTIVLNFSIDNRICQLYNTTQYHILLVIEVVLLISTMILSLAYLKSFHRIFICLICISTAEIVVSQYLNGYACETVQDSNWNLILRVTLPYTQTLTLLLLPICYLFLEAADHGGYKLTESVLQFSCADSDVIEKPKEKLRVKYFSINFLVFVVCHLLGFNTIEETDFELFPWVVLLILFVSLILISQPYLRKDGLDYEESELYRRRKTLNAFSRNVYMILICASPPTFFVIRQDSLFGFDIHMEALRVAVTGMQIGLFFYYVRLYTFAKVPFNLPLLKTRGEIGGNSYSAPSFNPDLCPETHPGAIGLNDLRRPLNTENNR